MKTVIVQNWEESEQGWGVRPDGFTVHSSMEQRDLYIAWYYATFNNLKVAPPEYTRISGDPIEVQVDDDLHNEIKNLADRKINDRVANCVHGVGNYFRKEILTRADLQFPNTLH